MSLDINALASLAATLEDLTSRLGEVARSADSEDEALPDLLEVERQLQTSSRRLNKIMTGLSRR